MELRHLRYFVAVAEELHFGRAAERVVVAQPALSKQVQALEAELGVRLLQRTRRRVELTDAGRLFLEQARQALIQADHAAEIARRAGRGELGTLTVGFMGSATHAVLPPILREYQERYPDVALDLRELSTMQQVDALRSGRIAAGFLRPQFLHPPLADDRLVLEEVQEEDLVVALPAHHHLASEDCVPLAALADEAWVMFARHLGPRLHDRVVEACERAGFSPRIRQEAIELQTIVGLVGAGIGPSFVPASAERLRSIDVVYRPLAEPDPSLRIGFAVAWRRGDASPVLAAFLELVRAHAAPCGDARSVVA